MNLFEALNNENSDELQKRIRLLDVSSRDCPKRKADRVPAQLSALYRAELSDRPNDRGGTNHGRRGGAQLVWVCGPSAASGALWLDPDRIPAGAVWLLESRVWAV